MAFIQAYFFSQVLKKQVALNAIVPQGKKGPFPVFYLLHGLSDDHTNWQRNTRIEFYVRDLPLIVVMPDGFRGFYTDNAAGPAYGRYMLEDVIGFAESTFPAIGKRAGRCIGGLSMGGFGSMRLAFAHPELFCSVTSHSAVTQVWQRFSDGNGEFERIYGKRARGGPFDLFALAEKLKKKGAALPKLRLDCGTEDFLLQQNRRLHAHLEKLKIAHEYQEFPGAHEWNYWDLHVREALAFHCKALKLAQG